MTIDKTSYAPPVARTVSDLRAAIAEWRKAGLKVGLVPTMGALHEGHLSLVDLAKTKADRVVVSIFVNPTQFAPHEDLDAYPRTEAADAAKLAGRADLIFAPTPAEMYPQGFSTTVTVSGVSAPLEGQFRPTHFAGVATVVSKLLLQALPDIACFGEKDWQQLQVIRRMVADLDIPVDILGGAIIAEATREGMDAIRALGFDHVDYLEVRDAASLEIFPAGRPTAPARILVAAKIGRTRLIDNMPV